MRYRYDINRGIQKIKTKTFLSLSAVLVFVTGLLMSVSLPFMAAAVTPVWNVTGSWKINFSVNPNPSVFDPNLYDLSLTQTGHNLTGTGQYPSPGPYQYAWNAAGTVSGSTVSLTDTYYLGAPGTVMHMNGTIASDGSMSGTWDDNYQGGRTGSWKSVDGHAVLTDIKDFDADKNLRPRQCSLTKSSKEVVDVSYKLVNDYDSAVGGNAWANDTIHRDLSIWNVSGNTYCAIVNDDGSFVTFAGASPNGTGTVGAGVKGEMDGGYRTVLFTGDFIGKTNYKTHGHLGTFDLACGPSTAPGYECNGPHPSYVSYFSNDVSNVDLAWWGWQYNTCQNGDWVNSIDANIGDITGTAPSHQNKKCSDDNDRHHHDKDKHHDRDFDNDEHHHVGPRA
jgi:hypothetical protein